PATAGRFATFSERGLAELGDLCTVWVTLNEPTGAAYQGYVLGEWPPGHRDPRESATVLINLIRAHWAAYERIKERHPTAQVGIAHHLRVFDPLRRWSPTAHRGELPVTGGQPGNRPATGRRLQPGYPAGSSGSSGSSGSPGER